MDLSSCGSRKMYTLTKSIKNHLSASVRLVVVDSEEELVLRRLFRNISFILMLTPRRLRPIRVANKTQTRDTLNFGPCKADWLTAFVIK